MATSALKATADLDQTSPESRVITSATSSPASQPKRSRKARPNPSPPNTCPLEVDVALTNAHPDRLRNTLRKMAENPGLMEIVQDHLLLGEDHGENPESYAAYRKKFDQPSRRQVVDRYEQVAEIGSLFDEDFFVQTNAATSPAKKPTKQKRSNHVVCGQCGEVFDADDNEDEEACTYHDGTMEPDEDAFVDWDENCHGDIYSREIKEEYPKNYIWDCCDAAGDEEGCTTGVHVEREGRKRPKH